MRESDAMNTENSAGNERYEAAKRAVLERAPQPCVPCEEYAAELAEVARLAGVRP